MEPITMNIPVLPLRGLTVFPHMNLTFDVERRISITALERAMEADQDIFLVAQREIGVDAPGLYPTSGRSCACPTAPSAVLWRAGRGRGCTACGRRNPISRLMWS